MDIKELIGDVVLNDIENVTHALKLQELVKERIKPLNRELDIIVVTKNGTKCCGSDYHLKILNERNYYQSLLEESEKQ